MGSKEQERRNGSEGRVSEINNRNKVQERTEESLWAMEIPNRELLRRKGYLEETGGGNCGNAAKVVELQDSKLGLPPVEAVSI